MRPIPLFLTILLLNQQAGAPVAEEAQPKQESPRANETLSERLSKQQGVLKPKRDVDPGLVKPAPEMNPRSTPEIKPPSPNAK
ncbi:hypothetical protein MJC1_00081 [Methylocystis sp. MJC1]|nr:hypothetical protein MJC1_00081 [Methylocystis sp. MJC1]